MSKTSFVEYVIHDAMQGVRGVTPPHVSSIAKQSVRSADETGGGVTAKAMFGGHGLYKDGVVFGIIADDELYFKVDDKNLARYKEHQSRPFTYEGKNKKVITMSYWEVPVEILEDRERLAEWIDASVAASRRAKKTKETL